MDLWYSSGQQFDYEIYNEQGEMVYQWSNGRMFPMMLVEASLEKDQEIQHKDTWNYTDQDGRKVPAGKYRVQFSTNFYVAETNVRLVSVTEVEVQ